MRILVLILALPLVCSSQSMKSIVMQLPKDCTPDLNIRAKKVLFKKASYELTTGDSMERIQYELDTPVLRNYTSFQFSFLTGQSGFGVFEIKRFKTRDNNELILFSKYSGTRSLYSQDTLRIFVRENSKLIEDKAQSLLPQTISISAFLKPGTPDSIKEKIENYANCCYYFNPEKQRQIQFKLFNPLLDDELEKWLLGNSFVFTWNGSSFSRKLVFEN